MRELERVIDPELGLDIVTLGFVRGISVDSRNGSARVVMTLTTPLCPIRGEIAGQVRKILAGIGLADVTVDFSFDPPWKPSPEVRAILGL